MGMFPSNKPRPFQHQYIYVNERKEKLNKIEENAKVALGMSEPSTEFNPENIRGKFVEGTKHLKRRKESGKRPLTYGVMLIALGVLIYVLHYLITGNFNFS
ncbi:MAG: hypothetical protein ACRCZY_11270 [Phocaeicola sp.]